MAAPAGRVANAWDSDGSQVQLVLEADQGGVKLTKTFTFKRGDYVIDVRHDVTNTGTAAVAPSLYLQLVHDGNKPGVRTLDNGSQVQLVLEGTQGGVKLTKTFTFKRGDYVIDVRHDVTNTGTAPVSPSLYLSLLHDGTKPATDSFFNSSYTGPTLIELLESLSVYDESHNAPFRFPVQLVARHNGHEANDFRGYMGRIEAGKVSVGDKLVVQPSGQSATVKDIVVSVQRVADLMGEIASASQEQSQGIAQVNATVTQMDDATQQNAAQAQEQFGASGGGAGIEGGVGVEGQVYTLCQS